LPIALAFVVPRRPIAAALGLACAQRGEADAGPARGVVGGSFQLSVDEGSPMYQGAVDVGPLD
jgi:hypothetical protein